MGYNGGVQSRYDILIIGGGINGLGIAAQAAELGLSVLLTERRDFGGGTTAASSRLIHGGLRYLQYGELSLVRESLRERGILARQRPHLVRPIQLLIPAFRGIPPPAWKLRAGLAAYDLLARDPFFPRSAMLSPGEVAAQEPGLTRDGLGGGAVYPDGQIEFPERLCVELVREAAGCGAEMRSYTGVAALREQGRHVTGAVLRDTLSGEEREVDATLVVNAAGPWVDAVNRLLRRPPPRLIGGTWGTHLVLPSRPEGPRGPLYAAARKDGRPFFLLPWDGRLLVGTTDVRCEGSPDAVRVQAWEIEYLLAETNRLFPGCRYTPDDVQYTTVGVRPLPASSRDAGAITRRHFLVDHGREHGIAGLVSVVGGKLTTYRSLAEQVVGHASALLGTSIPRRAGQWHRGPAPAELLPDAEVVSRRMSLPAGTAARLIRLYGRRYPEVLETIVREPGLGRPLVPGCPALAAEVVQAVERESARTVDDVLRRRLMLLPPAPALAEAVRQLRPQLRESAE